MEAELENEMEVESKKGMEGKNETELKLEKEIEVKLREAKSEKPSRDRKKLRGIGTVDVRMNCFLNTFR
jgi:hypothetical protein